jgi:hypothetical protein
VILGHQQLFDLLSSGHPDERSKTARERASATYDRIMVSFKESES